MMTRVAKGGFNKAARPAGKNNRAAPYGRKGGEPSESAICSAHDKKRSIDCMELDPSSGEYVCSPENQCKQSSKPNAGADKMMQEPEPEEIAMCEVHYKKRQMTCLEDDGTGKLQCCEDHQCKMPRADKPVRKPSAISVTHRQQQMKSAPAEVGMCSLHNKQRSMDCLMEHSYGNFVCVAPHICKVGSGEVFAAPQRQQKPQLPKPRIDGKVQQVQKTLQKGQLQVRQGKGKGGKGKGQQVPQQEQVMCSIHGKSRSSSNMTEGTNGMECLPGHECRQSNHVEEEVMPDEQELEENQAICSEHGKVRTISVMIEDDVGGYRCGDDNKCKQKKPVQQPMTFRTKGSKGKSKGNKGGKGETASEMCSLHNKKRSISVMVDDGLGGFQCDENNECKEKRE